MGDRVAGRDEEKPGNASALRGFLLVDFTFKNACLAVLEEIYMVIVIGGGASGLGLAWDLLLRSIPVMVVEMGDIGSGTSGRFHGLLHSGGRYVVSDVQAARECWEENQILKRVAGAAIKATGGYFLSVDDEGDAYVQDWVKGAEAIGLPVKEVAVGQIRETVENLGPWVRRGFSVPDGVLEGFTLLHLLRLNIENLGGEILTHTTVTDIRHENGRVVGVEVMDKDGPRVIACDAVVNAAGPYAGEVARLFHDGIAMQLSRGTMLIFANRRVPYVINRLAPPGDGDIIVPHGETAILGTTDVLQEDPGSTRATREEAQYLMQLGQRLFADMDRWRVLRAFTGVRPLYQDGQEIRDSRYISRDFTVIDHGQRRGLVGAFSLVGGKWTTYRLMAEHMADAVAAYLKVKRSSRTAEVPLQTAVEMDLRPGPTICECERVSLGQLARWPCASLTEWRTRSWFAMGPCQGTMCGHRGALLAMAVQTPSTALRELSQLRHERERGWWPTTWGDNARQWALGQALRHQTLAEEAWSDE